MQQANELEQRFGIANVLRFEETPTGLVRAAVTTPIAESEVYLQGAHVAGWIPRAHRPVLFLSGRSNFAAGKAIRGGVPIIFPWFNARGDGLPGPSHGFARTTCWNVESVDMRTDGTLGLGWLLTPDDNARGLGFDEFLVRFRVSIGDSLHMELETRNLARTPLVIREALHSYFSISDVHQVSVTGLEGATYLDHADNDERKQWAPEPIRFFAETDMLFVDTEGTCLIHDPIWNRRIVVEKQGSRSTVVWNPWLERASHLADLGSDEWQHMICVETANAADNTVTIEPGQSHTLTATIRVESID